MSVFNNILLGASAQSSTTPVHTVDNSIRFNDNDSAYMYRAFSGAGNNHVLSTLTDCIADTPKEEIGYVLAAWSQTQREDFEVYDFELGGQGNEIRIYQSN